MALFGIGTSESSTRNESIVNDNRALASGDGPAISASEGGTVEVQYVAAEAFDIAGQAVETLADVQGETFAALRATQDAARTEAAQLTEQLIIFGIPALVIFFLWRGGV